MVEGGELERDRETAVRTDGPPAERRDWDAALEGVRAAGGHNAVAALLEQIALGEFEAGHVQRVRSASGRLDDLPAEVLDAHPKLAVLRARIALYTDDRYNAQVRAERILRSGGLDPETEIRAHLVRVNSLWLTGFPEEALEVARQALEIADATGSPALRAEVSGIRVPFSC